MKKVVKRGAKLLVLGLLVVLLVGYPRFWYVLFPGDTVNLLTHITEQQRAVSFRKASNLSMLYVSEEPVGLAGWLMAQLNPELAVYTQQTFLGQQTPQEANLIAEYDWQTAQNAAKVVASRTLRHNYAVVTQGPRVLSVTEKSKFINKIPLGATITAFNDQPVSSTRELLNLLKHTQKQRVSVSFYTSSRKIQTVTGRLIRLKPSSTQRYLGITLVDWQRVHTRPTYRFTLSGITGPSAGLMMGLSLYYAMSNQEPPATIIAGTGTLNQQGQVGAIGGISQKVIAAAKRQVHYFLVPNTDYRDPVTHLTNYQQALATARHLKTRMTIIPVKNFNQALSALKKIQKNLPN